MADEYSEFKLVIEEETEIRGLGMPGKVETRLWNLVREGSEQALHLSATSLAEVAERIKSELGRLLEGEWEIAEVSLTISVPPAVNILVKKKD